MFKSFKEFAMGGNLIDMAVGIILGAAFGTVVKSLVDNVIMPPIGNMMNGINFSDLYVNLTQKSGDKLPLAAAEEAGHAVLKYGQFLQDTFSFLVIAIVMFILVKKIVGSKEEEEPAGPTSEELLGEIRDLLKNK